jgi:excisionase family DNA binding protein
MSEKSNPAILDHVQKPVFTFAEAAALLSLHPLTLRRMAARGELEVVRFGRAVRIPRDALTRLVDERRSSGDDLRAGAR